MADNTGTELAVDFCLIDTLLRAETVTIILHLKMHPTFVSDATPIDALMILERLDSGHYGRDARALGQRLRDALEKGRLRFIPDLYWNSSRLLWDMPPRLHTLFQKASLVILKGDANYRRLISDATWSPDTPFADVVHYFPAPFVALRTLKSDGIVGLSAEQAKGLDDVHSDWRHDGRHGVIQGYFPEVGF